MESTLDIFKEIKAEHEISQKAHEEFEQKRLDELGKQLEEDKKIKNQLEEGMMQVNNPVHFDPTIRCN